MATTINVPPNVREVLARSTITADRLILPDEQLDRKLYEAVNKVIAAAGGRWDRRSRSHLFEHDPRPLLGLAHETGVVVHRQNVLQAFYTPAALADRLVELADPQPNDRVLEPSCGAGALIHALIRRVPTLIVHQAYDIDSTALGKAPISFCAAAKVADFLTVESDPIYDVVVMNPPFAKDQDIEHVEHAWTFVRPGGRLVSIMSAGWSYPAPRLKKRRAFKAFVNAHGGRIEILGGDAFKALGVNVHSVMLRLDKP